MKGPFRRLLCVWLTTLALGAGCRRETPEGSPTPPPPEPAARDSPTEPPVPVTPAGALSADTAAANETLRRYYAAIAERDYSTAHRLWADEGRASGQTLREFSEGFAMTDSVGVVLGAMGRIEGAAGSRFVEIPVSVRARTTAGTRQSFEGTYVLRRSVVDGATVEQRSWRIYSASLVETP